MVQIVPDHDGHGVGPGGRLLHPLQGPSAAASVSSWGNIVEVMRQIFTSLRYHWCRASRPRGCYSWPGRRAESAPALWGLETCRERPAPTNWGEQTHKQLVSTLRRKPQEIKLAQRQLLLEDSKTLCRKDNFIEKILRLQYTYIYILQQYIFIHFRHYQFRSIINKLVYCLFVYTHSAVEYIRTSRLIFRY